MCVGLEKHKTKIAAAMAEPGCSGEVRFVGEIANQCADGSIASCDRWLSAVQTFFAAFTKRRLGRGVCRSMVDLQAAIHR